MANLNNQNYCLQKELEEFVHADDAVRMNLDRKYKVENIRARVDDVINRSQIEVSRSHAAMQPPPVVVERVGRKYDYEFPSVEKINRRPITSYSPMRGDPMIRPPFRPLEDVHNYPDLRKQYSFGREPFGPREPIVGSSPLGDAIRSKSGGKAVSFVEHPPRYQI